MSFKVMILGCGPAGIFAAHAAAHRGASVAIVSKKRKSEMYGAQYLHRPIPGLSAGNPIMVDYLLEGSIRGYREKVYGKRQVTVSPEELEENHEAWDIREAYDKGWRQYQHTITNAILTGHDLEEAIKVIQPNVVINTVPLPMLCVDQEEHLFKSEEVWAIGDAPERGVFCPIHVRMNSVVCNGMRDIGWYRASDVFGYRTAEWPGGRKPPIEGVAAVTKPISTTCTCHPEVHRVGRYGTWRKGVLSHEAYFESYDIIAEAQK